MPIMPLFRPVIATTLLLTLVACGGSEKPADESPGATSTTVDLMAVGEQKYAQVCASCHMPNGLGQEGNIPPLAGSEWVLGDPRVPISIALHGLQGPITVQGKGYDAMMQPWGMLPDADLAAVVTYVRASWGNNASPVTAEQVAELRASAGARAAWTADELTQAYGGK
jgi:mono/diheme cytochrome c family protein